MKLLIAAICSTMLFISTYIYYYVEVDWKELTLTAVTFFASKKEETFEQKTEEDPLVELPHKHVYEVTAYTAGPESTGKTPSHPAYGITTSGAYVKENHTIACPKELPFGTKIYIPFFDELYVCEDRGGAIKGETLDVYMESVDEAILFGRRKLDIYIFDAAKKEEEMVSLLRERLADQYK